MTGLAHCHQSMRIDMSAPGESGRRIAEPVRRSTHRKLAQAPRARPFAFTNPIRTPHRPGSVAIGGGDISR